MRLVVFMLLSLNYYKARNPAPANMLCLYVLSRRVKTDAVGVRKKGNAYLIFHLICLDFK